MVIVSHIESTPEKFDQLNQPGCVMKNQPLVLVDITINVESDVQSDVVPGIVRVRKCVYPEMTCHCMVNDFIEFFNLEITKTGMKFVISLVLS